MEKVYYLRWADAEIHFGSSGVKEQSWDVNGLKSGNMLFFSTFIRS